MKNSSREKRKKESMEFYEKYVFPMNILSGKISRVANKDLNHMGIFFQCIQGEKVFYLSTATCFGEHGVYKETGELFKSFTVRFGLRGNAKFCEMSEYEHLMIAKRRNDPVLNSMLHIQTYTNEERDGVVAMAVSKTLDVLEMINAGFRSLFKNLEDNHTFYSVSWDDMEQHNYLVKRIVD